MLAKDKAQPKYGLGLKFWLCALLFEREYTVDSTICKSEGKPILDGEEGKPKSMAQLVVLAEPKHYT